MQTQHQFQRRQLLKTSAAALLVLPGFTVAQSFPAKPIRLVVPFPPGGLVDTMARLVGPRLAQELGQAVVIDNKPGAGGNLGAAEVARSAPDGYTELLAKAKSIPGKLNYASNGNGTSLHLSAELLKSSTSTFITHIPYRGAAQAVTGLIAGEVDMMFENLPSVLGQIQGGSVKALAVTTRTRNKTIASVPTLAESGLPDFDVSAWYGLAAPAGTPVAVVARLEQALEKIIRDAEVVRNMESRGADVGFLNAQSMAAFMAVDAAKWQRVAAFAKITLG